MMVMIVTILVFLQNDKHKQCVIYMFFLSVKTPEPRISNDLELIISRASLTGCSMPNTFSYRSSYKTANKTANKPSSVMHFNFHF